MRQVVREKIRTLRLERGLTQETFCERAQISVDAVSRIEGGSRVSILHGASSWMTVAGPFYPPRLVLLCSEARNALPRIASSWTGNAQSSAAPEGTDAAQR